jgi:hypothetical protein
MPFGLYKIYIWIVLRLGVCFLIKTGVKICRIVSFMVDRGVVDCHNNIRHTSCVWRHLPCSTNITSVTMHTAVHHSIPLIIYTTCRSIKIGSILHAGYTHVLYDSQKLLAPPTTLSAGNELVGSSFWLCTPAVNSITPMSRDLLDMLQLAKKFPALHVTLRFITKSQALVTYPYPSQSPRPRKMLRDIVTFLRWGVISTSPKPQAGGPPLVRCRRLLIQYIHIYPPYLEPVPPIANGGRPMQWWQGHTSLGFRKCQVWIPFLTPTVPNWVFFNFSQSLQVTASTVL